MNVRTIGAGVLLALLVLPPLSASWADPPDQSAIQAVMHGMFNKPDVQLVIDPVVVEGGFTVAGWTQGDMGGRAFLKQTDGKWALILRTGNQIRSAEALEQSGVPADTAQKRAAAIKEAEKSTYPNRLKKLASFEGTVRMDGK
jgi:hypothetical protein